MRWKQRRAVRQQIIKVFLTNPLCVSAVGRTEDRQWTVRGKERREKWEGSTGLAVWRTDVFTVGCVLSAHKPSHTHTRMRRNKQLLSRASRIMALVFLFLEIHTCSVTHVKQKDVLHDV